MKLLKNVIFVVDLEGGSGKTDFISMMEAKYPGRVHSITAASAHNMAKHINSLSNAESLDALLDVALDFYKSGNTVEEFKELSKNRLLINANEIEEQLKLVQENKEIEEYLVSEMIIEPVAADKLDAEVQKIKNLIDVEGFKQVAMKYSIAETAIKGGDLGWVNENEIAKDFKSKIPLK